MSLMIGLLFLCNNGKVSAVLQRSEQHLISAALRPSISKNRNGEFVVSVKNIAGKRLLLAPLGVGDGLWWTSKSKERRLQEDNWKQHDPQWLNPDESLTAIIPLGYIAQQFEDGVILVNLQYFQRHTVSYPSMLRATRLDGELKLGTIRLEHKADKILWASIVQ